MAYLPNGNVDYNHWNGTQYDQRSQHAQKLRLKMRVDHQQPLPPVIQRPVQVIVPVVVVQTTHYYPPPYY